MGFNKIGVLYRTKEQNNHCIGDFEDVYGNRFYSVLKNDYTIGGLYEMSLEKEGSFYVPIIFNPKKPETKDELAAVAKHFNISFGIVAKIWNAYSEKSFEILMNHPEMAKSLLSFGAWKLNTFIETYKKIDFYANNVVQKLKNMGFSDEMTKKIIENKSNDEIELALANDIYSLCDVVAYQTINRIAKQNDIVCFSNNRGIYLAKYILDIAELSGNLFLHENEFLEKLYATINDGFDSEKVSMERCREMLSIANNTTVKIISKRVFSKTSEENEKNLAVNIVKRINRKILPEKYFVKAVKKYEEEMNITLAENQVKAILSSATHSFSIITGGPGTGKTTTVRGLIYVIEDVYKISDNDICLMAPTGKAAKRMTESTGLPARTIHSALKIGIDGSEPEKIDAKVIIVDESSMLDQKTATMLFEAVPEDSKLILVGDVDQLQSVGAGDVLNSIINSNCVACVKLDAVYRQGKQSPIVKNAYSINNGDKNLLFGDEFKFIEVETDKEAVETAIATYASIAGKIGSSNVSLLCPRRKDSVCCVNELNKELQAKINSGNFKYVTYGDKKFFNGDNVIQVKNYKGIANGDIGKIIAIYEEENPDDGKKVTKVKVDFSGNKMEYSRDELSILELAYAITVHKSQGSEYDTAIITILNSHFNQLQKNILYTAVTRAKRNVIIIGQKKALYTAISKTDTSIRNTLLKERICIYDRKFKEKNN